LMIGVVPASNKKVNVKPSVANSLNSGSYNLHSAKNYSVEIMAPKTVPRPQNSIAAKIWEYIIGW